MAQSSSYPGYSLTKHQATNVTGPLNTLQNAYPLSGPQGHFNQLLNQCRNIPGPLFSLSSYVPSSVNHDGTLTIHTSRQTSGSTNSPQLPVYSPPMVSGLISYPPGALRIPTRTHAGDSRSHSSPYSDTQMYHLPALPTDTLEDARRMAAQDQIRRLASFNESTRSSGENDQQTNYMQLSPATSDEYGTSNIG